MPRHRGSFWMSPSVEDGVVYLRGLVPGLEDVSSAEEVAGRLAGVCEVVEELEIELR